MIFSSPIFLFFFLPVVFLLYRVSRSDKYRNILLCVFSLVFYAFGQIAYVPLLIVSVAVNYASGILLGGKFKGSRAVASGAVIIDLAILAFYKYSDFIIGSFNSFLGSNFPGIEIALPIGISFFTFQGISYVIDIYRESETGSKSFVSAFLYISFFPRLLAGPIVKYRDIADSLEHRVCTAADSAEGIKRFVFGLGKKVLISDSLAYASDSIFSSSSPGSLLAWTAAACYTLQIYYDFSGYSDMSVGLGKMFGFSFPENFNYPYGASSIREFWRKWHITLSEWFRDYLYIPLGGNRKGKSRAALNRFIVFFCTGLWHGANWTFVFWGICHGILANLEAAAAIPLQKLENSFFGRIFCRIYTLLAVTLLFVVFRSENLHSAFMMIKSMLLFEYSAGDAFRLLSILNPASIAALSAGAVLCGNLPRRLPEAIRGSYAFSIAVLILSIISMSGRGFSPFIYFQF